MSSPYAFPGRQHHLGLQCPKAISQPTKIMIQTVTIDIINDKAMRLLQDLELLELIRMRKGKGQPNVNWAERHKGAMSKQPLSDIDNQLDELRNTKDFEHIPGLAIIHPWGK